MTSPLVTPDIYDVIRVLNQPSPGIATVSGAGTPRKWDERNGYGLSGATIVFTGLGVAKFTVRLWLWTDAHFDAWEEWKPLVAPPPQGQKPRILDIYHPFLDDVNIRSAGVEDRSQIAPDGETGLYYVDIKWLSYRKPLPQIGTGSGAQAGKQYKNNSANDAGDAQIQALLKQFNDLNK